MDPVVISPTIQQYNGRRYYLCGKYFQRDGERLHRIVWQDAHPDVALPGRAEGMDVHHVDHDRANNAAANLRLMSRHDHLSHHGETTSEAQLAAARRNVIFATAGNALLTSEQRAEASRRGWEKMVRYSYTCEVCGKERQTPAPSRARFCGGTCKATARRRRLGVPSTAEHTEYVCAYCGVTGIYTGRGAQRTYCSDKCSRAAGRARKRLA